MFSVRLTTALLLLLASSNLSKALSVSSPGFGDTFSFDFNLFDDEFDQEQPELEVCMKQFFFLR